MCSAPAVSALSAHGHAQSDEMLAGMVAVSARLLDRGALETLMQAIQIQVHGKCLLILGEQLITNAWGVCLVEQPHSLDAADRHSTL